MQSYMANPLLPITVSHMMFEIISASEKVSEADSLTAFIGHLPAA